ncbi:MAG: hypothetical protein GY940_20480 [bacterium]|nr:hypothetical protein [bacterium]
MNLKGISLKDLAIYISDYLRTNGIDTVLSGGACVTIYTENKYQSYDLDFVLQSYTERKKIKTVLVKIGFKEAGRSFKHKDTPYYVEFLSPPLSVGEEPVKVISSMKEKNRVLKLISPTDCVKDRLAAYYHWGDRQSLDQAVLVCRDNVVDLKEVERWSLNEGMKNKFEILKKRLT